MSSSADWDDSDDDNIKIIANPNLFKPLSEGSTNSDVVTHLCAKLNSEVTAVSNGAKVDVERARQAAALALQLQMELSTFLSDSEGRARAAKTNVKHVESMIFTEIRSKPAEKKKTDAAVKEQGQSDPRLSAAEDQATQLEVEYKKWSYVFGTAKDAHIFFRNIANGKNEWSA